jgi:Bacterial Ig domain/Metallo-peptidase family M12B Reprolysin-like
MHKVHGRTFFIGQQGVGKMKKIPGRVIAPVMAICLCVASPVQADKKSYGKHAPFIASDLPVSRLRTKLEGMSSVRRERAMTWLHRFDFPRADLRTLDVDREGGVLYVDPALVDAAPSTAAASAPVAAAIPTTSAFVLHSRPGSTRVIYLDFDGHLITGTAWNTNYAAGKPLNAAPYDTDGVPASFSTAELNNIINIWRRVAEDFAPFNVDVTTQLPASFGPTVGRILITRDSDTTGLAMPLQGAGGVAYVGVFGQSSYQTYQPALVYFNRLGSGREDYVAEASSHEMGHNLGLGHDGTSTATYYGGHGAGATSWGPIMGSSYNRALSEWSRGEYAGANNQQDDASIIGAKLTVRGDDHANTAAGATPLIANGQGSVVGTSVDVDWTNSRSENKGVIASQTDVDVFFFDAVTGTVNLTIAPHKMPVNSGGGNLDVQVELYSQGGALLGSASPNGATGASLVANVPAGRCFLHVSGVGDPAVPYTDYGSLGQFTINGVIPLGVANTVPPSPNPMAWEVLPIAANATAVTMRAAMAIDDAGSAVQYLFECTVGGSGCISSGWQNGQSYSPTGLSPSTVYRYRVKARDATSNETGWSIEAAVTTPAAPVSVNSAPSATPDSFRVWAGATQRLNVLANDADVDLDPLSIIAVTQGALGRVSFSASGLFYRSTGATGNDSFRYTISDGKGHSASATVSVTVRRR